MIAAWLATAALADATLVLDGVVPDDGLDHFLVPFEVPAGTAEIEVRHDDGSAPDILDWGLFDPDGWRGWGGGNTEPAVVGELAASRSYLPGPLPAGTWQVLVGKAKIVSPSVSWHLEIVLRDAPTLAPQARRPWVDPGALRSEPGWYAGDLHVHSSESGDADASLEEIAVLAEEQGLDFVVVTDHDTVTQDDLLLDVQDRHPDLLLIPGTEFTTYDGHAGAWGATAWVDHRIGRPGVTIEAAVDAYRAQGAVFGLNHPLLDLGDTCIGCAWAHAVPDGVAAIEVGTGGWSPVGQLFTPDTLLWWEELTDAGHRLAAVGGSDDHRAGQDTGPFASPIGHPVTLVYAEDLSVGAVLDGIRAARTVVRLQDVHDPMVELSVDGDHAVAAVTGAAGGELVWVVDGEVAVREPIDADDARSIRALPPGARARVEVWRDGHPATISSHVWGIAPTTAPTDAGCGCRGGGSAASGLLGLAALARRRRPPPGRPQRAPSPGNAGVGHRRGRR